MRNCWIKTTTKPTRKSFKSCSSIFTAKGFRWIYASSFAAYNTHLSQAGSTLCMQFFWQIVMTLTPLTPWHLHWHQSFMFHNFMQWSFRASVFWSTCRASAVLRNNGGWFHGPFPLVLSLSQKPKPHRYNTIKFHCPLGRNSAVLNNMCNNVLGAEKFLNTLSAAVMDLKIGLSPQALFLLFYCRSCSFSMAPFPLSLSPQVLTVALNLFSFSHQTVHAVFHFGMLALVFINNQAAVSLSGSFEISSTKK